MRPCVKGKGGKNEKQSRGRLMHKEYLVKEGAGKEGTKKSGRVGGRVRSECQPSANPPILSKRVREQPERKRCIRPMEKKI